LAIHQTKAACRCSCAHKCDANVRTNFDAGGPVGWPGRRQLIGVTSCAQIEEARKAERETKQQLETAIYWRRWRRINPEWPWLPPTGQTQPRRAGQSHRAIIYSSPNPRRPSTLRLVRDIDGVQTATAAGYCADGPRRAAPPVGPEAGCSQSDSLTYPRPLVSTQFRIAAQSRHLRIARSRCANTHNGQMPLCNFRQHYCCFMFIDNLYSPSHGSKQQ